MRVLLVTSRFPLPARRGNQVRTTQWLAALADHAPGLVCPCGPVGSPDLAALTAGVVETFPLAPPARLLGLASAVLAGRPLQEGLFAVAAARAALGRALAAARWDLVVVQMVRSAWALAEIDRLAPGRPILFDAVDAMGLHFAVAAPGFAPLLRPGLGIEARRCRRREGELAARAVMTTAVARRDLAALAIPPGRARLVPVAAARVAAAPRCDGPPTVLLSGNLGYRPTVAAARFFAREVWPAVRAAVPSARWVLAGARPPATVRALARLPGVEVHADPDDLAPFLARSTVAVAPMASGSGVPMKVLEAWAAGVPVVAHPRAAAGLELGREEAVVGADSGAEWVHAVVTLLTDAARARVLGAAGQARWRLVYHPDRVRDAIRGAVAEASGSW